MELYGRKPTMTIKEETISDIITIGIGLFVASCISVISFLIGHFFPEALVYLAPKLSLSAKIIEPFRSIYTGGTTLFISFVYFVVAPVAILGLLLATLYRFGEFGKWLIGR